MIADDPLAGPMFARYVGEPADGDVANRRIEAGFFVRGNVKLPSGYQRKTIGAYEAATLRVAGLYGLSHQHRKRVLDWIASNGYQVAGDVMEIYSVSSPGEKPMIEIRVPIQRPADIAASGEAITEKAALKDILAARDYQRAAAVLIPDRPRRPAAHRKWLGEVADRLRVIRGIVDAKYANDGQDVHSLLTPIIDRAQSLGSEQARDAAQAAAEAPIAGGYTAELELQVLRQLDRLMVRAYLKSSTADELYAEVVAILLSVNRADDSTRPPVKPNI